MRYNKETLDEYCKVNSITIMNILPCKINRDVRIEGKCTNCINIFDKKFRTLYETGPFCNYCTIKNGIEKIKEKHHENFNDPIKKEKILEKRKNTCIQKYDCEYAAQYEGIKTNIKNIFIEKYNGHPLQCQFVKDKVKNTNLERYDKINVFQVEKFKEKSKETSNKKYGTDHPMQNKEIMEKSIKSSYKLKSYTLPSGKIIKYQGYENFALDDLLKIYNEDELVNGSKNVPEIWYETDGKKHRHYVDFFIPNENKCIEVKSTFTLKNKKDHVFDKQNYAKQEGYIYMKYGYMIMVTELKYINYFDNIL
jgi:hypothetical protein